MLMNNTVYRSQIPAMTVLLFGAAVMNAQADSVKPHHTVPMTKASRYPVNSSIYNTTDYFLNFNQATSYKTEKHATPTDNSGLVSTISGFYHGLQLKQELLGKDFESVLVDNLWDLYLD